MMQNKFFIFMLFCFLFLFSCIERYTPDINAEQKDSYVVSGQVTDQEGFQIVRISKTSSLSESVYNPVPGCTVNILDDKGNSFMLTEDEENKGDYKGWIDQEYLKKGISYQVSITTPDGMLLVSDYDKMPSCPSLDSVYFFKEEAPYQDPNYNFTEGVQFYVDFTGTSKDSPYLRWDMEETWEYHAYHLLYAYIDGWGEHIVNSKDSSRMVCWKSQMVREVFTSSTKNLIQNSFQKFPLHYVNNHSERLAFGYSLLIHQYALSEEAYIYWDLLKLNGYDRGGLYEKQPMNVEGNIQNMTNPEQKVMGFFGASSVKTKRIFVNRPDNIKFRYQTYCTIYKPEKRPNPGTSSSPIYVTIYKRQEYNMNRECWDCLSRGGTNIEPEFWPM